MNELIVYTDGACSQNGTWNGGWAFKIVGDINICISGGEKETTNNKMELKAAVEALKYIYENELPCDTVNLHVDSAYVVNAFNQNWITNWLKNGWITSKKEPVKNKDLWQFLLLYIDGIESQGPKVIFTKVSGHSDNAHNNEVDRAAVAACKAVV